MNLYQVSGTVFYFNPEAYLQSISGPVGWVEERINKKASFIVFLEVDSYNEIHQRLVAHFNSKHQYFKSILIEDSSIFPGEIIK